MGTVMLLVMGTGTVKGTVVVLVKEMVKVVVGVV
jgi:hypothetical protein